MVALANLGLPAAPHTLPTAPLSRQGNAGFVSVSQDSRCTSRSACNRHRVFPLHRLTPELMLLLLGHLDDIDHASVLRLRLVSKSFDYAAVRVAFRNVTVNNKLLDAVANSAFTRSLRKIFVYTRHIQLQSNFDKALAIKLLANAINLRSICWKFEPDTATWLPTEVLSECHDDISIQVTNLPLRQPVSMAFPVDYFELLPSRQLTSLSLALPTSPLVSRLDSLRCLLVKASNLTSFHYQERGQGTMFWFESGEKLPAFKHLTLQSYNWKHSAQEARDHWQLHNLRSLRLINVSIANVLRSIDSKDLKKLRCIQLDDKPSYLDANSEEQRRDATKLMQKLIKHDVDLLESVEITCNVDMLDIESLIRHADTLRHLRLRDHAGFDEDFVQCPCLHPKQVVSLSEKLDCLETLEVDLDTTLSDPVEFLRGVAQFRNLRELNLHVQTVISPNEDVTHTGDRDFDAALSALRLITQDRDSRGLPLLNKMTINVGGWRPVLVRRLSAQWRAKNVRGLFAERYFVFKRNGTGVEYIFTEKACDEALGCCPDVPVVPECSDLWNVLF